MVNPLYIGDTTYPSPPNIAEATPHLKAPDKAPLHASHEAWLASSCFLVLASSGLDIFGVLCVCLREREVYGVGGGSVN